MAFPDVPRVVYQSSPLDEVICQLRFPPILRIDAEPPVGFQEAVRPHYPFYEPQSAVRLPAGVPAELAQFFPADITGGGKSHTFTTRDQQWAIGLRGKTLSLTSRAYQRWEGFRERLAAALAALEANYAPAFFIRIGLRYRNVIRRSRLPERDPPWTWGDLIQQPVAGLSGTELQVEGSASKSIFPLDDTAGRCLFNYGVQVEEETQEEVFVLDADCFTEDQTEPDHALERLDSLHRQAHLLFRWCITDALHESLLPQPVT